MSQKFDHDALVARATAYFDRPSFSSPSWLGDDEIVFIDDRSGTKQASLLRVSTGEISPLTQYNERLLSLKTSPKAGRVVFGMDVSGNERQQVWTIASPGEEPLRLTTSDDAIHEPGAVAKDGAYVLMRSNARDEGTFDIVGVPTSGGELEMWMEEGGQVSPVDLHADGVRALVVRLNGNLDSDLLLLEKSGEVRNLTEHEGEQWVLGAAFDEAGTGVWLLSNLDREYVALVHLDIGSGQRSIAFEDPEWDVELFKISPDQSHIALSVNENGTSRAVIASLNDIASGTSLDLPAGVIDQFNWAPDSSRVTFGFSTVENPSVLMSSDLYGNVQTIAEAESERPQTYEPETVRYKTFDDLDIPAWFFKPEGEGPHPVLVDIHGGPESQRRLNYSPSGPVIQYLTSLGIGVLTLNVRGSTGYGKAYSHLDDKDLRLDSVKDVAYAVEWLRGREDVDPARIAVYGRSYGGFMTLASLVFHPDLWAAGIDVVGIANFVSFLERTGPWRRAHREHEYGSLEHDREMLERISPLTHIDNIRVPLMVCHGRHDPRVPLFEAEQVVEAVRKNGQEVLLRVYDDEGHALSKRKNEIDAFVTAGEFLQEHLGLPDQV